jgi:hypothetical protein
MKNIYRQLADNDPVSTPVMKGIVAICAICALFIVVSALVSIWNQPPKRANRIIEEADPEWIAEQNRLARKHGPEHVIIYEPGETPYYYCGEKKDRKCSFL